MSVKPFKTIDEQIEILKSRGLTIPDEMLEETKNFLYNNNYYRISGYTLTLRNNDVFYNGVCIQNIFDIYNFDAELRSILFRYLEIVETRIKSVYSYELTKKFGPLGYREPSNFPDQQQALFINGIIENAMKNPKEDYLKHHKDLGGDLPFWVAVDVLKFGDFEKLYSGTDVHLKMNVASNFGVKTESALPYFSSQIRQMVFLRNFCAHGARLYNRIFASKPSLDSKRRRLLRTDKNGKQDDFHVFAYILLFKVFLKVDEFTSLKEGLYSLCSKYPFVNLKYCGFPENWYDLI